MNVYSILPKPVGEQQAFILDHGKIEDGALKYQDDSTSYGWNTRQFNKLKPGAFVLNRHPGKITKDRKFEIYGGGYVEKIEPIDDQGNVVATISHAFNIVPPIKQGDTFIENFTWDSKNKKEGTWGYFWNQYGMNTISLTDFENLLQNVRCIPIDQVDDQNPNKESEITEEEIQKLEENILQGFNIVFEEDGTTRNRKGSKFTGIGRKIDFEKIQKSRNVIGALGEEIVMHLLMKEAEDKKLKAPIHVSKNEGDGTGYDIRCWDELDNEIHVEVKASKGRYADGFEMTRNEIKASEDINYEYRIYRVYDLDVKTRSCKIKIYEGPVSSDNFNIVTTQVIVYQK